MSTILLRNPLNLRVDRHLFSIDVNVLWVLREEVLDELTAVLELTDDSFYVFFIHLLKSLSALPLT